MMKLIRIGLAVNHSYAYYRGVMRGIAHYAETRPQWLLANRATSGTHLDRDSRAGWEGSDLNQFG